MIVKTVFKIGNLINILFMFEFQVKKKRRQEHPYASVGGGTSQEGGEEEEEEAEERWGERGGQG